VETSFWFSFPVKSDELMLYNIQNLIVAGYDPFLNHIVDGLMG
jgi:hypothetical protein